jgi:hypothetical protein
MREANTSAEAPQANERHVRRIRLKQLHEAFAGIPSGENIQTQSVALACAVLRALLSEGWFDRHVMPAGKQTVLTVASDPTEREKSFVRIIDLAEVLYNLQDVLGFDECLSRLRDGNIEGTLGELDFGRMLYLNKVMFRFVIPQGVKKRDYDFEILYPNGVVACADAKCKIEATEFSENGIVNALHDARKQLPNEAPGIIFVKVPARWIADPSITTAMIGRARRWLGGVSRIVSVKFYAAPLALVDNMMRHDHAYKEISNARTDFGDNVDWSVFKRHVMEPGGSGMPAHWQRILFFPTGIRPG